MLANKTNIGLALGRLNPEIHLPATAKLQLVEFIAKALPHWRDHPDRPDKEAETDLTEFLCDYLNSATQRSTTWSHIQFRTETGDETIGGRRIDLTVKPRNAVLFIEGRRHTIFQPLFPIECKRLPTPVGIKRDEREYVTTKFGTTGGIQRFKFGHYGVIHPFAAMIAYVQKKSSFFWLRQVNRWIREEASKKRSSWSNSDMLKSISNSAARRIRILSSRHQRRNRSDCELRHLWIEMK